MKIGRLYRKLSVSLDRVRGELTSEADLKRRVCLTVLDEDLSVLLEECESSLLTAEDHSFREVESLESRSDTVIEETELVLSRGNEIMSH